MADPALRVAVVGSGVIGRLHAGVLNRLDRARLVAVADVDAARAQDLSQRSGAPARSVEDALSAADVDAVCVCVPSGLHAEIGERAARNGKHVLVEKPIDVDLAAADRLIEACGRAGVQLGVISQHRFDDSAQALKHAIDDGRLGRLYFGAAVVRWWREQSYYDTASWRGTLRLDGGALLNQGVHHIDLLLWLLGPATGVYARYATAAHTMECEDLALLTLDFACGALATVEATTAAYPGFPERLSISGENGTIALEGNDIAVWGLRDATEDVAAGAPTAPVASSDPTSIEAESHQRQVADFVEAVRNGRPPAVTGDDGRRALELILAARESARTGRRVELGAAALAL